MFDDMKAIKDFTMDQVLSEIDRIGLFLSGTPQAYSDEGDSRHIPVFACKEGIRRLTYILAALTGSGIPLWVDREDDEDEVIE